MQRTYRLFVTALLMAWAGAGLAQTDAGVLRRPAELRESPAETARSLAALPAQSLVNRLGERQGSWIQVRTPAGLTGWVHLFDVGAPGTPGAQTGSSATGGALRGLASLFSKSSSGSAGTTVATTTVGIRGLSAEDIANAQPNPVAVRDMEALRQSESQAREFASSAALNPRSVEPLPRATPTAQVRGPGGEVTQ